MTLSVQHLEKLKWYFSFRDPLKIFQAGLRCYRVVTSSNFRNVLPEVLSIRGEMEISPVSLWKLQKQFPEGFGDHASLSISYPGMASALQH